MRECRLRRFLSSLFDWFSQCIGVYKSIIVVVVDGFAQLEKDLCRTFATSLATTLCLNSLIVSISCSFRRGFQSIGRFVLSHPLKACKCTFHMRFGAVTIAYARQCQAISPFVFTLPSNCVPRRSGGSVRPSRTYRCCAMCIDRFVALTGFRTDSALVVF